MFAGDFIGKTNAPVLDGDREPFGGTPHRSQGSQNTYSLALFALPDNAESLFLKGEVESILS